MEMERRAEAYEEFRGTNPAVGPTEEKRSSTIEEGELDQD